MTCPLPQIEPQSFDAARAAGLVPARVQVATQSKVVADTEGCVQGRVLRQEADCAPTGSARPPGDLQAQSLLLLMAATGRRSGA